jgi:hypothetical protein
MNPGIPVFTAETFVVPLKTGRYLVYGPLWRAAFVANARVVNFLAELRDGVVDTTADPDGALVRP